MAPVRVGISLTAMITISVPMTIVIHPQVAIIHKYQTVRTHKITGLTTAKDEIEYLYYLISGGLR
jgi:hypothetical protein